LRRSIKHKKDRNHQHQLFHSISPHEGFMRASSDLYLPWLLHYNLCLPLIASYHPRDTNLFPRIERFRWLFKLAPIRPPNQHCENLVRIRFVEVDESITRRTSGVMSWPACESTIALYWQKRPSPHHAVIGEAPSLLTIWTRQM
jgi:hypothetical protein